MTNPRTARLLAAEITNPIRVSFSGGKDSVATYLYLARDLGFRDVECVFCDTGHESEITYNYIETLRREHGFQIHWVQPLMRDLWVNPPARDDLDDPLTMESLSIHKKRFPAPSARFCTTHLKMAPLRRWINENTRDDVILASGVRADESPKRAEMSICHWDEYMERWRILPIHKWTASDVFDCHARHSVPPNPLYLRGCGRVGCYPCIMARKPELKAMAEGDPDAFKRLHAMEERVANAVGKNVMTLFSREKTSAAYRSVVDEQSGLNVPTADDVRRWALGMPPNPRDGDLFFGGEYYSKQDDDWDGDDIEAMACSSPYGLCE
jgi:3'-phosphoadenosine 5'-phosphosulfate sulfotransferase (PAPS reductase)/FAD synthetase